RRYGTNSSLTYWSTIGSMTNVRSTSPASSSPAATSSPVRSPTTRERHNSHARATLTTPSQSTQWRSTPKLFRPCRPASNQSASSTSPGSAKADSLEASARAVAARVPNEVTYRRQELSSPSSASSP